MNEEEKRKYEAFQYWIQTNTERGVTTIPDNLCLFVVNLIKSLQKENEELKERIREHTLLISPYYVKENFIPVQIIEDFIKKYQKLGDEFYEKFLETNRTDKDLHDVGLACDAKVQVLQELLEGGKI